MGNKLLVVDDNKELVSVLQGLLSDLFEVISIAYNAEEAVQNINLTQFDIIILDINLEDGKNGGEVLKYLTENPENSNSKTPIIILSAIINDQFIEKFKNRFAGIVKKPFDHEAFLKLVKDTLEIKINESLDDIPVVDCDLPFPLPQLQQKVSKVIDQVKKNSKLKLLFQNMIIDRSGDDFIMTHAGMIINISTGICMKLEWYTDKTLEKFVYAAYLHDMALTERPDLAKVNGNGMEIELLKEKLSPADHKLLLEHSHLAAAKIDEIEEIPQDVSLIVKQHHELPKENGFPSRLSFSKITPLSTVFIVSHDLTNYIFENPKWTVGDYLAKNKVKFKGPHFSKVLNALVDMS